MGNLGLIASISALSAFGLLGVGCSSNEPEVDCWNTYGAPRPGLTLFLESESEESLGLAAGEYEMFITAFGTETVFRFESDGSSLACYAPCERYLGITTGPPMVAFDWGMPLLYFVGEDDTGPDRVEISVRRDNLFLTRSVIEPTYLPSPAPRRLQGVGEVCVDVDEAYDTMVIP